MRPADRNEWAWVQDALALAGMVLVALAIAAAVIGGYHWWNGDL